MQISTWADLIASDESLWIEVVVNGVVLAPRQPLHGVPYSVASSRLILGSDFSDPCSGDGSIRWDQTTNTIRVCNGTEWRTFSPDSIGGSIGGNTVFVTSTTYTGNLGGIEGANQKCRQRAQAAGLTHTSSFRALLPEDGASLASHIDPNQTYYNTAGGFIGTGGDWIASGLGVPVLTEQGNTAGHLAWTGEPDLTRTEPRIEFSCDFWTATSRHGEQGNPNATGTGEVWHDHIPGSGDHYRVCGELHGLYCIQ
jgi:hypothetical protein